MNGGGDFYSIYYEVKEALQELLDLKFKILPAQALEFGKQWLSVFAPGHQAVVAVHPDGHNGSQNMHIHMVINSVRKPEYNTINAKGVMV